MIGRKDETRARRPIGAPTQVVLAGAAIGLILLGLALLTHVLGSGPALLITAAAIVAALVF
ncbi:MAG: hypothetical protein AB7K86_03935 [Rhodospirillales bacterium]